MKLLTALLVLSLLSLASAISIESENVLVVAAAGDHLTCPGVDTGGRSCVPVTDCGILDQGNTYYLLMNDVSSEQTCFWVLGEGSTLDLNQYTVYYDQLDIPDIPNKNFETDDMSGWDLSQAPGWYRNKQIRAIDDYVLVLPESSVVLSPPFRIPRADYSFVASVYMLGLHSWPHRSNLTIDLIRTDTGEAIPCGVGLPERRYNRISNEHDDEMAGVVCNIRTPDTPEVRIRMRTEGGSLIDYVDFRGFLHPAIATKNGGVNPSHQYFAYAEMPSNPGYLRTLHVINGDIIQGNARSGKAIVTEGAEKMILKDLKIIMEEYTPNGKGIEQANGVYAPNAGGHVISNILLEVPSTGSFSRDIIGGAIMLYGNATITDNTIRTDTSGILIGQPLDTRLIEGLLISGNRIEMGFAHAPMDRNHFGAWFPGFKRPVIKNNVITGQGFGGIAINNNLEADVFNNTINLWAKSGMRYDDTGTSDVSYSLGIEFYDYSSISTRNRVHDNKVTMIVDPSRMKEESRALVRAFNIRNRYAFDESTCGNNSIYDNVFTAINLHETPNSFGLVSRAAAVQLWANFVPTMKEQFFNNTLQSNNILISGGLGIDKGIDIYDNVMRRLDVGVTPAAYRTRPFENIFNWNVGISVRDNVWENTDKYDYWRDSHTSPILFKNTIAVKVVDLSNNPVANANVIIKNVQGENVATGATDSQGRYETVVTDFEVIGYSQGHVNYNPHTITISKTGYNTFTQESFINKSKQLDVTLTVGQLQTCSGQDGRTCSLDQDCSGTWTPASDTERCCLGTCGTSVGICTDSDGGRDYYVKGTTRVEFPEGSDGWTLMPRTKTDYCDGEDFTPFEPTSNMLNEFYCEEDGSLGYEMYPCPHGCGGGECKDSLACTLDSDCSDQSVCTIDRCSQTCHHLSIDLDGSGTIGMGDVMQITPLWTAQEGDANYDPNKDLDFSGNIGMGDVMRITPLWTQGCP